MRPFGSAPCNGSLREGKGSVATENQALKNYPHTFCDKPGINQEELLGAAARF
jgi:osmotically inducible protein OsmC